MSGKLGRREFIRRVAQAAAAAALPAAAAAVTGNREVSADAIPVRILGKTGEKLPVLGLGSAPLAKIWGGPGSFAERVKVVRRAYEKGIRYFDTAGNYMEAQAILGEALEDVRDQVHLVSRVETTNPKTVRRDVEQRMKKLKTDRLDTIQIHGTPGLEQMSVKRAMQVNAELVKLRDEGVVRFVGFSAHSYFDKALALIETGGFDQCMLACGYIARGHDQRHSEKTVALRDKCMARAHELGMGLATMKVMGAAVLGSWASYIAPEIGEDRIRRLPGAAIRHVLADKRIHVLVIGVREKKDVDVNVRILTGDTTYTEEDRKLLAEFTLVAMKRKPLSEMRVE